MAIRESNFTPAIALLAVLAIPAQAVGAQPWDSHFNSDAAAILNAAAQIQVASDQPVDILLEDYRYDIGPSGRLKETYRKVYRILHQEAIEGWSAAERQYQPWRDSKPVLRARVITSDGAVHDLDPKTIADAPAADADDSVFSDARIVRAPLPAVAAGAIIEYEITVDSAPSFPEAGFSGLASVFDTVPIERFHVALDAPKGTALKVAGRMIADSAIQRTSSKGATHIELDLGPLKARKDFESYLPFNAPNWPGLAFTTAQSWQILSERYSAIVDAQIQAADLKPLMPNVDPAAAPEVIVAQLTSRLHRNIRYTGVEFGDAAIVPARPGEVMQRKYGDCKDKSTLLVAMLRSAGLKASVALLDSGYGTDTDPEIPGVDRFNHAIVYVDLPGKPMWIDATASQYRVGALPSADQGRQALIASKGTTGLVTIPEHNDEWERETYEIRFKDFGPASITQIMEANGPYEATLRGSYVANSNVHDSLEKFVKANYRAKSLGRVEISGSDDLSSPVRVLVEAVDTPQAMTTSEQAQVNLGPERVLEDLPWSLREAEKDGKDARPRRSADFIFPSAGTTEHVYRLYPPALFRPGKLPPSNEVSLGPLTWSRSYKAADNGVIEITYRLEIPRRRITAVEYETIREGLKKYESQSPDLLSFVPQTAEFLAIGQTGKAISVLREDVAQHPGDATTHIRFSHLLVECGFGGPAREEAKKATELDPKSSQAWQALAWALQNDSFGRLRHGDWDRDEAVKDLRKAVELDPEDRIAKADLAILLEYDARGERYGSPEGMKEAIGLYREVLKKQANAVFEGNLTASLYYSGQFKEAAEEAAKASEPQRTVFLTALTAIQDGPAKAIVGLQSSVVDPSPRLQMLAQTALTLLHARRYDEAHVVIQAIARSANDPQINTMEQMVAKMKKHEDTTFDAGDPSTPVKRLMMLALTDSFSLDKVKPLVTAKTGMEGFDQASQEIRGEIAPVVRQLSKVGMIWDNVIDLAPAILVFDKKGDDAHGYRISQRGGGTMPDMFVVKEDGGYRILGGIEDVGKRVLDLLKQNDVPAAQWWLDEVAKEMPSGPSGWIRAARSLWSGVTPQTRGPDAIRLTAAAMIASETDSPESVRALEEAVPKGKNEMDRAQIELALCEAFSHAKQWDRLLAHANRLKTSKTFATAGLFYAEQATEATGDWKAMETTALEQTKNNDDKSWRNVAIARMRQGNTMGAEEAIGKLKTFGRDSEQAELRAWNRIFAKKVDEDTLASLKKTDGVPNAAQLNFYLIALVNSILDKPDDALDALKKAVGDADPDRLDARAWVVYASLCGKYGFESTAASVRERARSAKNTNDAAKWALATLH